MVASKAKAAVSTMATKTTTGESMLWGSPIEFWDLWGVRLLFIGAVVGVGGLVLSALSAYVLYRVADVAQKDLAAETSRAATELAQAQADIEKSKAESAHANERIAELSTQAEQLRKNTAEANAQAARAQLELEKFKRPRSISEEQRNRIAEKMTEFSGQQYFGTVANDIADAWDIWREISVSLELAGWNRQVPPGRTARQYGPEAGTAVAPQVGVMVLSPATNAPSENMRLHNIAKALAAALTDEPITEVAGFAADISQPTAIAIVIGPKP